MPVTPDALLTAALRAQEVNAKAKPAKIIHTNTVEINAEMCCQKGLDYGGVRDHEHILPLDRSSVVNASSFSSSSSSPHTPSSSSLSLLCCRRHSQPPPLSPSAPFLHLWRYQPCMRRSECPPEAAPRDHKSRIVEHEPHVAIISCHPRATGTATRRFPTSSCPRTHPRSTRAIVARGVGLPRISHASSASRGAQPCARHAGGRAVCVEADVLRGEGFPRAMACATPSGARSVSV